MIRWRHWLLTTMSWQSSGCKCQIGSNSRCTRSHRWKCVVEQNDTFVEITDIRYRLRRLFVACHAKCTLFGAAHIWKWFDYTMVQNYDIAINVCSLTIAKCEYEQSKDVISHVSIIWDLSNKFLDTRINWNYHYRDMTWCYHQVWLNSVRPSPYANLQSRKRQSRSGSYGRHGCSASTRWICARAWSRLVSASTLIVPISKATNDDHVWAW